MIRVIEWLLELNTAVQYFHILLIFLNQKLLHRREVKERRFLTISSIHHSIANEASRCLHIRNATITCINESFFKLSIILKINMSGDRAFSELNRYALNVPIHCSETASQRYSEYCNESVALQCRALIVNILLPMTEAARGAHLQLSGDPHLWDSVGTAILENDAVVTLYCRVLCTYSFLRVLVPCNI